MNNYIKFLANLANVKEVIKNEDNYTKFLTDLANGDEVIKNEDEALILLSSLSDEEHKTFILTLINDKQSLSYNEVSTAFVNHELKKKDKQSSIAHQQRC